MLLSQHFSDTELGVAGMEGTQTYANAEQICELLLEPIRAQFGPVSLSCGYRSLQDNARVGGTPLSQHLYIDENSAADIVDCGDVELAVAFNWIRLDSHLPFDQLILEINPTTQVAACIHISYNGAATPRRQALTGETNGQGKYSSVQVNP